MGFPMYAKAGHLDAALGLDSPKQHKNHNDDQYRADQTDAAMAETVAIAAKTATKPAKQEDNKYDDQNETQRHPLAPLVFKKWDFNRVSI